MTKTEKDMWVINLENAASSAYSHSGLDVVNSVFQKYGANKICDLSPYYYSEVFADLEQITNDN